MFLLASLPLVALNGVQSLLRGEEHGLASVPFSIECVGLLPLKPFHAERVI